MSEIGSHARLRNFVGAFAKSIEQLGDEKAFKGIGRELPGELVAQDDWLPAEYAAADPVTYRQYLLHCDSSQRFSVVSFVWGPGQSTPIHDNRTRGLIGMLRGSEVTQNFELDSAGVPQRVGLPNRIDPGQVAVVTRENGEIHRVENFHSDRTSISIHVYAANIGSVNRSVYRADGTTMSFISGYSNTSLPNLWDLSKEAKS